MSRFLSAAAACGLVLGSLGLSASVFAMPDYGAAVSAEQNALDDMVAARAALSHNRAPAAIEQEERAETVLLNAQQAGTYRDPPALGALEQAHADLLHGKTKEAQAQIVIAEDDLRTP